MREDGWLNLSVVPQHPPAPQNFPAGLFFFMPLRYNKEENRKVNHIRNLEGLSRFGHVSD